MFIFPHGAAQTGEYIEIIEGANSGMEEQQQQQEAKKVMWVGEEFKVYVN